MTPYVTLNGTAAGPIRITLDPVRDLEAVGRSWRALEADADPSFFQSWTWVGCLAEERMSDPLLLRVQRADRVVGLALFNRRRDRWCSESLWLNQTGVRALDSVFIEHNGVLLARDATDLLPACMAAALGHRASGRDWCRLLGARVRLAGVDSRHLLAARQAGSVVLVGDSAAPYVNLTALPDAPDAYLASLSSNTRYQIRRSNRCFARLGPMLVRAAATLPEAETWLDTMAGLNQAVWTERGQPGAFSSPDFLRFHRALIRRALPRGEVELLRISAGPHVLGYLYNFRLRDRVLNYQSGFDYALARTLAGSHAKPGLSCHHAAILRAQASGAVAYDFLAGDDRFKRNLAKHQLRLYWLDMAPRASGQGLAVWLHSTWQTPLISGTLRRLGFLAGPVSAHAGRQRRA